MLKLPLSVAPQTQNGTIEDTSKTLEDAEAAIEGLNKTSVGDRQIRVAKHAAKPGDTQGGQPRPGAIGGRGGYSGGRGRGY